MRSIRICNYHWIKPKNLCTVRVSHVSPPGTAQSTPVCAGAGLVALQQSGALAQGEVEAALGRRRRRRQSGGRLMASPTPGGGGGRVFKRLKMSGKVRVAGEVCSSTRCLKISFFLFFLQLFILFVPEDLLWRHRQDFFQNGPSSISAR